MPAPIAVHEDINQYVMAAAVLPLPDALLNRSTVDDGRVPVADAGGMGIYGGTLLEGSVGSIAAAHVFAACPTLAWGTELFGPLLLKALIAQDMFLAGTIVLLLGVMTVIGTLISDIVLVLIDPRIRLEET